MNYFMPSSPKKVYAIVGGTSGIGGSVANLLWQSARFPRETKLLIAGRRIPPSDTHGPNSHYTSLDVTSMKEVRAFAKSVSEDVDVRTHGLSGLVLSAGHLNLAWNRSETGEGIEATFALNYLSKACLVTELAPALSKASNARVVSVMAGGNGGRFDASDLQMTRNAYNCIHQAVATGALIDIMTYHLAQLNQAPDGPRFYHLFPGIVNTNNPANAGMPAPLFSVLKLVMPLVARSPDTVAKEVLQILQDDAYADVKRSGQFLHPGLKVVKPYPKVLDEAVRGQVWQETLRILESIPRD
ncbi:hypothetical protein BC830DRAFT_1159581 [Chytriomyces sp. MP71]|nr:hypothetical protein BC830DRAFT_1159581 [Chytriomyces sp. MP71]